MGNKWKNNADSPVLFFIDDLANKCVQCLRKLLYKSHIQFLVRREHHWRLIRLDNPLRAHKLPLKMKARCFYSILTGFLPDVPKPILVEKAREAAKCYRNQLLIALLPLSRALPSQLDRHDFHNHCGRRSTTGFSGAKRVSVRIPRWSD